MPDLEPPALQQSPRTSAAVRVATVLGGIALYVTAVMLDWLTDIPAEAVKGMQHFAYAIALGTTSIGSVMTALTKKAEPEPPERKPPTTVNPSEFP